MGFIKVRIDTFERLQKVIFFLIIFFISSQVGLHFWPNFSYISGVRVDYLSPTLYLVDIFIVTLIAVFLIRVKSSKTKINLIPKRPILKLLLILFALDIFLNTFLAKSPGAHLFGVIKLSEFIFLGFYVASSFKNKHIPLFIDALSLSAIISSGLAIWQFLEQSSVGGIWYFLGERTFTSTTIGISTVNFNEQWLRPYGAFPHPNVLAFFLLMAIIFMALRISYEKSVLEKGLFIISLFISSIALVLTFSRVAILLAVCFFLFVIYLKLKQNRRFYLFGGGVLVLGAVLVFPGLFSPQFLLRGFDFRQELIVQSLTILSSNLYFGIGLNNFFIHQALLVKEVSPILFQPPHNIFVLALLSLGIFGFWILPAVFVLAIRTLNVKLKTKNKGIRDFYRGVLFILISIIIVGMFDHFFLTLEQGQLILALTLGLSFARLKTNN